MDLLNDEECTTRLKRCCKKTRQPKYGGHPSILARWLNDYEYRDSLSQIGCTERHKMPLTELPRRTTHTSRQKLREFKIRRIGFSLWIETTHYIDNLTLLKRKENAGYCTTNTWQRLNKIKRTITRSQQVRQRKGQAFEGIEEYDYALDPRTGWRF